MKRRRWDQPKDTKQNDRAMKRRRNGRSEVEGRCGGALQAKKYRKNGRIEREARSGPEEWWSGRKSGWISKERVDQAARADGDRRGSAPETIAWGPQLGCQGHSRRVVGAAEEGRASRTAAKSEEGAERGRWKGHGWDQLKRARSRAECRSYGGVEREAARKIASTGSRRLDA